MSSFLRTIQRRVLRNRPDYEAPPQPVRIGEAGYTTLRATRGWIAISNRRLAAQRRMAAMLDHILPERAKKAPKVWRKPAAVPPSNETRQQRRAAERSSRLTGKPATVSV